MDRQIWRISSTAGTRFRNWCYFWIQEGFPTIELSLWVFWVGKVDCTFGAQLEMQLACFGQKSSNKVGDDLSLQFKPRLSDTSPWRSRRCGLFLYTYRDPRGLQGQLPKSSQLKYEISSHWVHWFRKNDDSMSVDRSNAAETRFLWALQMESS